MLWMGQWFCVCSHMFPISPKLDWLSWWCCACSPIYYFSIGKSTKNGWNLHESTRKKGFFPGFLERIQGRGGWAAQNWGALVFIYLLYWGLMGYSAIYRSNNVIFWEGTLSGGIPRPICLWDSAPVPISFSMCFPMLDPMWSFFINAGGMPNGSPVAG